MKTFSYGLVLFCLTRTPIGWLKPLFALALFQLKPYLTPPTSFNFRVVFSTYSSFFTFLTVILYSLRSYEPQVSFSSIDSKFLGIAFFTSLASNDF